MGALSTTTTSGVYISIIFGPPPTHLRGGITFLIYFLRGLSFLNLLNLPPNWWEAEGLLNE
jgi:hypothetical protein